MKFVGGKLTLLFILFILACLEIPIVIFTIIDKSRFQLSVLIAILIVVSGCGVITQRIFQLEKFSFNYDFGTFLYLHSIYMMTTLIIYRLIYAPFHFEGNIIDINFGYKNDKLDDSIAFTPELTSVGHCAWGFCIVFLFPWFTEPKTWQVIVKEILSTAVIVYPIYNLIKRSVKSVDTFASSSYFNNNAEWTYGVILGIVLGFVIMVERKMDSDYQVPKWVSATRITSGFILMVSVLLGYIFTITSWNETYTGKSDGIGIIILIILLAIQMIVFARYMYRQEIWEIRQKAPILLQRTEVDDPTEHHVKAQPNIVSSNKRLTKAQRNRPSPIMIPMESYEMMDLESGRTVILDDMTGLPVTEV